MESPLRFTRIGTFSLSAGIITGLVTMALLRATWTTPPPAPPPSPPADSAPVKAWRNATPHIDQAEKESADSIDPQLRQITGFFDQRLIGARPFAEDAISIWGKWALVYSYLPLIGDEEAHKAYLKESFQRHLFKPEELEALVKSVLTSYASELEGVDNRTLVKIQADLEDGALTKDERLALLRTEQLFHAEFRRVVEALLPAIGRELGISVGYFVASEVAGQIATQVLIAVATRMGVSGGILGAGAASGTVTLGIGFIVSIIVDQALSWALEKAGYDPAGEIAAKTREALRTVERSLIEGHADQLERYRACRQLEAQSASDAEREQAAKDAEAIATSGELGLRFELQRQHELRSKLRREALKKMILVEGGL